MASRKTDSKKRAFNKVAKKAQAEVRRLVARDKSRTLNGVELQVALEKIKCQLQEMVALVRPAPPFGG